MSMVCNNGANYRVAKLTRQKVLMEGSLTFPFIY
uniref:Uncharacterized protein n=1 Tax=Triticum urartu TaxID=4572 RepID=A0A8R7QHK9_TRIUA